MHELSEQERSEYSTAYQNLIASQQTLLLSTVSEKGEPSISYAPYIRDEQGIFYIFTSELASHTRNLLANKQAAILFIQPESESSELFARERITFKCSAEEITSKDSVYEQQLDALHRQFGQVVSLIKSLPDFHLFALKPESGQYVVGFGKAFDINMIEGKMSRKNKQ